MAERHTHLTCGGKINKFGCGLTKPVTEFYRKGEYVDGTTRRHTICKICTEKTRKGEMTYTDEQLLRMTPAERTKIVQTQFGRHPKPDTDPIKLLFKED